MFLVIAVVMSVCGYAHADGGTIRLREQVGQYLITAFTSPTPFRQGLVDISVLVQHAMTGECASGVVITIRMRQRGTSQVVEQQATSAAATNKLLQAAIMELPAPGWWDVDINIQGEHGTSEAHFSIEAGQPLPRWQSLWPWYSWPVLAIILFACHQRLVKRKAQLLQRFSS